MAAARAHKIGMAIFLRRFLPKRLSVADIRSRRVADVK